MSEDEFDAIEHGRTFATETVDGLVAQGLTKEEALGAVLQIYVDSMTQVGMALAGHELPPNPNPLAQDVAKLRGVVLELAKLANEIPDRRQR